MGLNENYCRRWLALSLFNQLRGTEGEVGEKKSVVAAQKSRFVEKGAEFFTITLVRPLALSDKKNSSISLGLLINEAFKSRVSFWNDPAVPSVAVNETCERCGLSEDECDERVAPAVIFRKAMTQARKEASVQRFVEEMKG